ARPSAANGNVAAPSCRPCSRKPEAAMQAETLAHWRAADALFDQWLDLDEAARHGWPRGLQLPPAVDERLRKLIGAHRRPDAAFGNAGNDLAGRTLGSWTLDEELGRGGMAVVHRAHREQGMGRQQAAIKILTLAALGASGRERFRREAEILARLNHP